MANSFVHFVNCAPMAMPNGQGFWRRENRGEQGVDWDYFCPTSLFRGAIWRSKGNFDQYMSRCVDLDQRPYCKQEVSLEEERSPRISPSGSCKTTDGTNCLDHTYRDDSGNWRRGCWNGRCATESTIEGFARKYGVCSPDNPAICNMNGNQLGYLSERWLRN